MRILRTGADVMGVGDEGRCNLRPGIVGQACKKVIYIMSYHLVDEGAEIRACESCAEITRGWKKEEHTIASQTAALRAFAQEQQCDTISIQTTSSGDPDALADCRR